MQIPTSRFRWIISLIALSVTACFNSQDNLGSSEIGNPNLKVAQVVDQNQKPIANQLVRRIHTQDWAQRIAAHQSPVIDSAWSDAQGNVRFKDTVKLGWQYEIATQDQGVWSIPSKQKTTLKLQKLRIWKAGFASSKQIRIAGTSLVQDLSQGQLHLPPSQVQLYRETSKGFEFWTQVDSTQTSSSCPTHGRINAERYLENTPALWSPGWAWISGSWNPDQELELCLNGKCQKVLSNQGNFRQFIPLKQAEVKWTLGEPGFPTYCGTWSTAQAKSYHVQWILVLPSGSQPRIDSSSRSQKLETLSAWMAATTNLLAWRAQPTAPALLHFARTQGSLLNSIVFLQMSAQDLASINPLALKDSLDQKLGSSSLTHRIALIDVAPSSAALTYEAQNLSLWRSPDWPTLPTSLDELQTAIQSLPDSGTNSRQSLSLVVGQQLALVLKQTADLGLVESGNFQTGEGAKWLSHWVSPYGIEGLLDVNRLYLLPSQAQALQNSPWLMP
jgi:hypothetical protein